jgi:hypothetical protein
LRVARLDDELGLRLRMQARLGPLCEPPIRVWTDAAPLPAVAPAALREVVEETLPALWPGAHLRDDEVLQYDEDGRKRWARCLRIVTSSPEAEWTDAIQTAWLIEQESGTSRTVSAAVIDSLAVASAIASPGDADRLAVYLSSALGRARCDEARFRATQLVQAALLREAAS